MTLFVSAVTASCGPATPSTQSPGSAALPIGAPQWTAQLSSASSAPSAGDLAVGTDGSTYVVGSFQGSLTAGATELTGGTSDALFVAKISATGEWVWAKSFGGVGSAHALAVATAGDQVLVSGTFSGSLPLGEVTLATASGPDVFVLALTGTGEVSWARRLGGSGTARTRDLAVTTAGRVLVVGGFDGELVHGERTAVAEGMQDGFAVIYEPGGAPGWIRTFGDAGPDAVSAGAFSADGDVILAGSFFGDLSPDHDVASIDDTQDAFVARLTGTSGELTWARQLGDTGTDAAHALAVDAAGNVFVAGTFDEPVTIAKDALTPAGNADLFLARLDSTGTAQWARSAGGPAREFGGQLALAGDTLAMTGAFEDSGAYAGRPLDSAGGLDGFVATYDTTGAGQWAARFGGTAQDDLRGVALSEGGDVTVSGAFDGNATLGPTTLTAGGARDVIVLRIHP